MQGEQVSRGDHGKVLGGVRRGRGGSDDRVQLGEVGPGVGPQPVCVLLWRHLFVKS